LVDGPDRCLQLCWSFSIFLEAVAILPQLFMVTKTGEAENITSHYLFALGSYRALYILNWIYRYYTEGHFDPIAVCAGVLQTVLYCDFFYLYVTKGRSVCVCTRTQAPGRLSRAPPLPLGAVLRGRKLQVLP
jgi:uncharacterized membrane protein (DUF485 family)